MVVYQIVNKSLRTHLTVHCVFQCSTWAVNKSLVHYVNSTFIDTPSCYIKTRNHCKVCSNYYLYQHATTFAYWSARSNHTHSHPYELRNITLTLSMFCTFLRPHITASCLVGWPGDTPFLRPLLRGLVLGLYSIWKELITVNNMWHIHNHMKRVIHVRYSYRIHTRSIIPSNKGGTPEWVGIIFQ